MSSKYDENNAVHECLGSAISARWSKFVLFRIPDLIFLIFWSKTHLFLLQEIFPTISVSVQYFGHYDIFSKAVFICLLAFSYIRCSICLDILIYWDMCSILQCRLSKFLHKIVKVQDCECSKLQPQTNCRKRLCLSSSSLFSKDKSRKHKTKSS